MQHSEYKFKSEFARRLNATAGPAPKTAMQHTEYKFTREVARRHFGVERILIARFSWLSAAPDRETATRQRDRRARRLARAPRTRVRARA